MLKSILAVLIIWVLINVLFVLVMMPLRKSRRQTPLSGNTLSPAVGPLHQDEPASLRHVISAIIMGTFFLLVPPIMTALQAVQRLVVKIQGRDIPKRED